MKRDEYIFTIGFSGNTAMVDGKALGRYKSASTRELLDAGLYKPALASAVRSDDPADVATVLEAYNRVAGTSFLRVEELQRVFGLETAPEKIDRVKILK